MSQRIFYEVNGRVEGPVSLAQLQLLAGTGMLQPHHKVRTENSDTWHAARQVKGLFSEDEPAPPAALYGKPVAAPAPAPAGETPFGAWENTPPPEEAERIEAFDFFSESSVAPAPAPPAPKKTAKTTAAVKPTRKGPEKPARPEPATPLADPLADTGITQFGLSESPVVDLPAEEETTVLALPADEDNSATAESMPAPAKAQNSRQDRPETSAPPRPDDPAPKRQDGATEEPTPVPTSAAEVIGQAVELIGEDSARLLDGKTVFRLHRAWLLATSKFSDGTSRTVYLRLQRIDAGVLEQRLAARRGKGGPYPVLSFIAADVRVALAFQGSDKLYRTFLEKVILMSNVGKK